MLNVNGKDDLSYRYKMEPINSNINGKGNGVYTTILNLKKVAKYLNQPSVLLLKYLSLHFGSICNEEKNTITGGYSTDELQKALQLYINRFVICPSCLVPETIPQINKVNKKSNILEVKCSSCGKTSEIKCNNKLESKTSDLILRFLEKNDWVISSKGMMVNQTSNENSNVLNSEENENEINPFG
jgi:translation initiation factor 5